MLFRWTTAAALLFALSACGPDTQQTAQTVATASSSPTHISDNTSAALAAPTAAPARTETAMVPPKGARYTLFCLSISGVNHTALAMQAKALWQQATGRRDWYVIHQEDQSNLYFGYYRSISDPREPKENARAAADRQMIQTLKDNIGDFPFAHAMLLPLDAPDPSGPPEWNLVNAKGEYSIEVAAFRGVPEPGSPDRKQAALDSVREARAHGIEAYYYNGDAVSSVCIGAWPKEAIEQPHGESEHASNPQQSLMVVPEQLANIMPTSAIDKSGNDMTIVHNENKVVDPSLIATLKQYPVHSLNGAEDNVEDSGQVYPRPSFIVAIPHGQNDVAAGSAAAGPRVNLLGGSSNDNTQSVQSRLRSMGQ